MGPAELMVVGIVAFVIHGLVFGFFCQNLAEAKGYNPKTAYWIGVFTGLLGLIFMVGMPDRSKK